VRLFRQQTARRWDDVVQAMAAELAERAWAAMPISRRA
jgi:hypothetical protein